MINEELAKSIDTMLDTLFTEESVEKADPIAKDSKNKADEVVNKAPKGQDDASRGAGRPKQISDVPKVDQDGKRSGDYDKDIKERDGKEEENKEAKKQAKDPIKKSEEEEVQVEELNKSEKEELEAFRKAKADSEAEELKKAEEVAQENLIKSVVEKVASRYEETIEGLKKSLAEQTDLVKAVANAPQRSKSVTNISTLEKSQSEERKQEESFSKSQMLDAAEELCKSGKIKDTAVIELENNGYIYDPEARAELEKYLQKKS